jgi:hypothetical protein
LITLNPVITGLIDGQPFGLHGELIGAIYKIVRDVQAMQLGRHTQEGRQGLFTFEGKLHTIKTLAGTELSIVRELEHADPKRRTELLAQQAVLQKTLKEAKQDFSRIVAPFLAHARGAKEPMFMLISESCTKRGRVNSLLFNWAKSSDDEMGAFDKAVASFVLFDEFCTDLINFLGDLVQSCPKARAQFEQLKQEYMRKRSGN